MAHRSPGAFFCRNALTLSKTERMRLTGVIDRHVADVTVLVGADKISCNLYISGSLARGEPCVEITRGEVRLHSDVDWVLVGELPPPPLGAIEKCLNARFPAMRDTLYFLPASNISRLFSASACDLMQGMTWPLAQSFELDAPVLPRIGAAEMMEVVVYQIAGALSADQPAQTVRDVSFWSSGPAYQRLKAVVDMMRAMAVVAGGRATLSEAWRLRDHARMRQVFDACDIWSAASEREAWVGTTAFTTEDLARWLRKLLVALLPAPIVSLPALIESYRARLYRDASVLHLYPLLVLIEGTWATASDREFPVLSALHSDITNNLLELVEAGEIGAASNFPVAANHRLKSAYISDMITRKDCGGAIWHWAEAGGAVPTMTRDINICTLGPAGTDAATLAYSLTDQVRLVDDFRTAMHAAVKSGCLALVPCGAVSPRSTIEVQSQLNGWVDLNFEFCEDLLIVATLVRSTKPMSVALRVGLSAPRCIGLHPSTEFFARRHFPDASLKYFANKVAAVDACACGEVDGCVGSHDIIARHPDMQIFASYRPQMVWSFYGRPGSVAPASNGLSDRVFQ